MRVRVFIPTNLGTNEKAAAEETVADRVSLSFPRMPPTAFPLVAEIDPIRTRFVPFTQQQPQRSRQQDAVPKGHRTINNPF
jgi:hypothetical protein